MAPLVALIADPRHVMTRGRRVAAVGSAGARDSRTAPGAPDRSRARRDRRGAEQARRRDRRIPRHPALARPRHGDHSRGADRGEERRSQHRAARSSSTATPTWRTRTSSSARTWSCWSAMAAISSACRCRPIARSGAAARDAPACRRARRISSRGCSSRPPTSRCCISPRWARPTRRRSGGCRWPPRRRAARRSSTCCRWSRASASPPSCRFPRTRRAGRTSM